jgi:hypothetical protein
VNIYFPKIKKYGDGREREREGNRKEDYGSC